MAKWLLLWERNHNSSIWGNGGVECWLNSEFVHFVNKDYKIVAQNLTKRFVDHRGIGLAAKRVSELPFHHAERGFDVAALVVMGKKFLLAEFLCGVIWT